MAFSSAAASTRVASLKLSIEFSYFWFCFVGAGNIPALIPIRRTGALGL
jgi:hypothetical protein